MQRLRDGYLFAIFASLVKHKKGDMARPNNVIGTGHVHHMRLAWLTWECQGPRIARSWTGDGPDGAKVVVEGEKLVPWMVPEEEVVEEGEAGFGDGAEKTT